jgi:hypothetical protein
LPPDKEETVERGAHVGLYGFRKVTSVEHAFEAATTTCALSIQMRSSKPCTMKAVLSRVGNTRAKKREKPLRALNIGAYYLGAEGDLSMGRVT